MTRSLRPAPVARVALAVAIGAALVLPSAPASAADPTPAPGTDGTSSVSVTVPVATPLPQIPPGGPRPGAVDEPPGGSAGRTASNAAAAGAGAAASGPAAAPCTPTEPAVPTAPERDAVEAAADRVVYQQGDTVTVTAAGYRAGENVQLVLFSEPKFVGTFVAAADGTVASSFPLPDDITTGPHAAQLTGWCTKTAAADILVGTVAGAGGVNGLQGVPAWVWWVAVVVGAVLVLGGSWWALRVMRSRPLPDGTVA